MPQPINYRSQLLQAIEAFLEGTDSARTRAQRIVRRCYTALNREGVQLILDELIWGHFFHVLTDSLSYQDKAFLQEAREMLLGHSQQNIVRTTFIDDYRPLFTADEAEWYAHLLSLLEFIEAIPYEKIHQATFAAWRNKNTRATARHTIPEVRQAEQIEAEYRQRTDLFKTLAARSPSPEHIGDETFYNLALREVSALLTGLSVGRPAVYCGYPVLAPPYSEYGTPPDDAPSISGYAMDISPGVQWAKRVLEALASKGGLFISWRLSKAPTFGADVLLVSLH